MNWKLRGRGVVWGAVMGVVAIVVSGARGAPLARATPQTARASTLIDSGWLFHLGDVAGKDGAMSAGFDDAKWKHVDLPHDYVLEGKYVRMDDKPGWTHGDLPVDVGWYRKHFVIAESEKGKVLRLDFDGVFRDSQVWLNGQLLGRHPGGYGPFSYDITKVAKIEEENVIAVRVDPREFEGHWYEGGGIYRHVHLTALPPVHVAQWGTYVVSNVGADGRAELTIRTEVENADTAAAEFRLISEIVGPEGVPLQGTIGGDRVPALAQREVVQRGLIARPKLWSLREPNLYELRTTILADGKPADFTTTTFGIRTIRFDADKGFFLNGEHVEIQGVAMHQDLPGVGIAVPDSLQAWRVEQLKKFGANGWRTAHNPPNEAVLEACDRLGMLVMDENRHLGDAYGHHSLPGTTANDLGDLSAMIQRDRNHPSVIMWSMCNEEGLRGKPEGMKLFAQMTKRVKEYDRTRPITSAINGSWIARGISDEDIIGVNYHFREYDAMHAGNPHVPMFGSETTNEKTTRGEYADNPEAGMRSAYNLSEAGWQAVAERPFMAGAYVWTGFDYKGETNPYHWPDVSNHTGLLDTCGFPKDRAYYFQSCWSDKPMVHLLPASWNWAGKEGQKIRVIAFSNAKRVELLLNGQSLGVKDVPRFAHAEWEVAYAPGTLSGRAMNGDDVVATDTVETAGPPTHLKVTTERTSLHAGAEDAVIVAVALLDEKDRAVPDADRRVTFHLKGSGLILGVGNGNPADHDTDKADNRKTFHGRCIAVVEAGNTPGDLEVSGTSEGLAAGGVVLRVK